MSLGAGLSFSRPYRSTSAYLTYFFISLPLHVAIATLVQRILGIFRLKIDSEYCSPVNLTRLCCVCSGIAT